MFDPFEFEVVDWDDEEDAEGNLAHCLRRGVDEVVVDEVLRGHPVEISKRLVTAGFAIVGPDASGACLWTLLFDRSYKRGDWLRPVTGWQSRGAEVVAWEKATNSTWRGNR